MDKNKRYRLTNMHDGGVVSIEGTTYNFNLLRKVYLAGHDESANFSLSSDGTRLTHPNGDGFYLTEMSFTAEEMAWQCARIDTEAFVNGREYSIGKDYTVGVLPSDKGPYIQVWQMIDGDWQESGDCRLDCDTKYRSEVLHCLFAALSKSVKGQPTPNECLTH